MPHKDPEAKRLYMRKRYVEKAADIKAYQKRYREENAAAIVEKRRPYQREVYLRRRAALKVAFLLRAGGKCARCPEDDLRVLEFHHRDRATKSFELTKATNSGSRTKYSMAEMVAEADKCDVLCSNCHAREHRSWTPEELQMMIDLSEVYFAEMPPEVLDET